MIKNVISVKNYGVKNQLYARYHRNMLESLIYKERVYSGVRYISEIDPFQGIHVVIELGYLGANFTLASGKIYLHAQSLQASVLLLIHLFLSGVCPPLNTCFELGAMQTAEGAACQSMSFVFRISRGRGNQQSSRTHRLTSFCHILHYCIFNKLKVFGSTTSSKSVGTLLSAAFSYFMSLYHVFGKIFAIFVWSVLFDVTIEKWLWLTEGPSDG